MSTTYDPLKHFVVYFSPTTLIDPKTTLEMLIDNPPPILKKLRSKPLDKERKLAMHKSIQKVKRSIRAKKEHDSILTYDDMVNEELASFAMIDSESPKSLDTIVMESPSTT